jgi:short-subunit dehydrogenase involved in D-alanine esterification of teichoic acids
MKLAQRTILITGGTSGIGLELARQLQQRGNTILVTGRDPDSYTQSLRVQLQGTGVTVIELAPPRVRRRCFAVSTPRKSGSKSPWPWTCSPPAPSPASNPDNWKSAPASAMY